MRLTESLPWHRRMYRLMRPLFVFAISVFFIFTVVNAGLSYLDRHFIQPVEQGNEAPIPVEIRRGSSVSTIANQLYDAEVIRNKAVFKIYVDFTGKGSKLRAGQYVLAKSMDLQQIIDRLAAGDGRTRVTVKILISEGMTARDIANTLVQKGLLANSKRFLELCDDTAAFSEHEFLQGITHAQDRIYKLEGYLFPDTYEFFEGTPEDVIIKRLLTRFIDIYSDEYASRAQELGMSMDQIVALASLIEKEAKRDDFKKVSAVFHNRLKKGMKLESDAPLQYIKGTKKLVLSGTDMDSSSLFNTYKHTGLPVGPICNPGKEAIEAALFPDETLLTQGYYFFCLTDPKEGTLVFTKTLAEHEKEVAKYRPLWEAFDKQQ